MKKESIFAILLISVFIFSCKSADKPGAKKVQKIKDGHGKTYWPVKGDEKESLKGEGTFKNYKEEGKWTLYHKGTGEKLAEGPFKDGKQEGPWLFYHRNGKKSSEGSFTEGEKTGEWTTFHATGELQSKANYVVVEIELELMPGMKVKKKLGSIEGVKKYFYPSGKEHKIENYKKGKRVGQFREVFEDGKPKEISEYKDDKYDGRINMYWPNGKHKQQGQYSKGEKTGAWKWFHPNGNPSVTGSFKNSMMDGNWKFYSKDNLLMKEGRYATKMVEKKPVNKEDGLWTFYRYNGGKARQKAMELTLNGGMVSNEKCIMYENGKVIGSGIMNGLPKAIFEIVQDGKIVGKTESGDDPGDDEAKKITHRWTGEWLPLKKNGEWKDFMPGGNQLKSVAVYMMGKKSGKYIEYYPNKKVMCEGEYQSDKMSGEWKCFRPDGSPDTDKSGRYMMDKKSKF